MAQEKFSTESFIFSLRALTAWKIKVLSDLWVFQVQINPLSIDAEFCVDLHKNHKKVIAKVAAYDEAFALSHFLSWKAEA